MRCGGCAKKLWKMAKIKKKAFKVSLVTGPRRWDLKGFNGLRVIVIKDKKKQVTTYFGDFDGNIHGISTGGFIACPMSNVHVFDKPELVAEVAADIKDVPGKDFNVMRAKNPRNNVWVMEYTKDDGTEAILTVEVNENNTIVVSSVNKD